METLASRKRSILQWLEHLSVVQEVLPVGPRSACGGP